MVCRVVMPLSRGDRVEIMGKMIRDLDMGNYEKEYLIVCDNNEIDRRKIEKSLEGLRGEIIFTGNGLTMGLDADARRMRITQCWNIIRDYLDGRYELVLGIEDDGNFHSGDFLKIESSFKDRYVNNYCRCGFVSGVEAGRWGNKMIGAWRLDESKEIIRTVPYKKEGLEGVHAAGFYFFVSMAELISSQNFHYNFFGPDVCFGLDISDRGYLNFIDYSVRVGHDNGVRVLEVDEECVELIYGKEHDYLWRGIGVERNGVSVLPHL